MFNKKYKNILSKISIILIFSILGLLIFANNLLGLIIGLIAGIIVVSVEYGLQTFSTYQIVSSTIGLILGLIIASLTAYTLSHLGIDENSVVNKTSIILITIGFAYLGFVLGYKKSSSFNFPLLNINGTENTITKQDKILDTSVIIDGRIADICETYFLEGTLLIPKFVLRELQFIADSSDRLKRNRGRRGLEILKKIQKQNSVSVRIDTSNFPELNEVDSKLVQLAKEKNAKIITNDFNLNKVAELHGVTVLNINDLANALKPVVLPDEEMQIHLIKRGKEYDQGIGYLEDGTMVVVDDARNFIGKTVDVLVTSVIQTAAGRMIFSKLKKDEINQENWEY